MEITLDHLNHTDETQIQIVRDITLNAYYLEAKQYGTTATDAEVICDENFHNSLIKIIKVDGIFAGWVFYKRRGQALSFGFLYVIREFRGRGVGSKALELVIEQHDPQIVYSHVFIQNETSQKLHEKLGFKKMSINYSMDRA